MANVEKIGELEYKLNCEVSKEDVDSAYQRHLAKLSSTVEMKGFRKGKVPVSVVESKFAKALCQEVAGIVIQSAYEKALAENDFKVAGQPDIDAPELKKGESYSFTAKLETYPVIELVSLDGKTVEKQVATVTEQDVDAMLDKIGRQHSTWTSVERKAASGDKLALDYAGFVDGNAFDGGDAENVDLVLGSGRMIEGFESSLEGVSAGDETEINVTFPEDYNVKDLAGKAAVFKINVHSVSEEVVPPIDDALAEKAGFKGGIDEFRGEINKNMTRELGHRLHNSYKQAVLDALLELNPMDVPNALVDVEIKHMQKMSIQQMMAQSGKQVGPDEIPDIKLPREPFEAEAKKRVTLGLLLADVIEKNDIKADPEMVKSRIEEMAAAYEMKDEVVSWYYNNKQMLAEIEAAVLEDQAIDKIAAAASIADKEVSFDEIMEADK